MPWIPRWLWILVVVVVVIFLLNALHLITIHFSIEV
jgi:hypothetical protein